MKKILTTMAAGALAVAVAPAAYSQEAVGLLLSGIIQDEANVAPALECSANGGAGATLPVVFQPVDTLDQGPAAFGSTTLQVDCTGASADVTVDAQIDSDGAGTPGDSATVTAFSQSSFEGGTPSPIDATLTVGDPEGTVTYEETDSSATGSVDISFTVEVGDGETGDGDTILLAPTDQTLFLTYSDT